MDGPCKGFVTVIDMRLRHTWQCGEFNARKKAFTPGGVGGMIDEFNCDNPTDVSPGSAQATVRFDALKSTGPKAGLSSDPKAKGNAHLGLSLMVDSGGGLPNLEVVLGVNVNVCDNGDPDVRCPTDAE
jgi:hypothetical protein